ncbi:hypothetical protein PSTT_14993 [Puccinia striiformis]|uniref:RRM domain-containing protein n=1 Tax=Puccinia striiformis TaxID=27350 RepID=A0A2S4UJT3_9BASI|nr:hypothetical protein PSTT_14993 [Puccinia striiformis]
MSRPQDGDRNQEATVYMGNLDERCTDALVWELMLQAGPVVNVHLPKDRVSMSHQGYGFCEFLTEDDAEYACKIMNQIKLYGKPIRVNKASSDRKQVDIGANLFIVQTAKIARNPTTGQSNGYGFVSYESFEAADTAIESMNGQFLMNKAITVQYAFKKDGKGERHGTPAERLLAAQARKNNALPSASANNLPAPPPSAPNPMRYVANNGQSTASNHHPGSGGAPQQNGGAGGGQYGTAGGGGHHGHQQQGYHGGAHHNPAMTYHRPPGPPTQHQGSYPPGPPPTTVPMAYRPPQQSPVPATTTNAFQQQQPSPNRGFPPPPPAGFAPPNGHQPFSQNSMPPPPAGFAPPNLTNGAPPPPAPNNFQNPASLPTSLNHHQAPSGIPLPPPGFAPR